MSEGTDDSAATAPTTETWTFGGSRVGPKNVRCHAWVDASGQHLLFKARGHHVVGSEYEVTVERKSDGGVSLHDQPRRFVRQSEDDDLRDTLATKHRAAEVHLTALQRERRAKDDDPFEQALNRLVDLMKRAPTNQRTTLAAYVLRRLLSGL